jgi:RNA recognition motif-containing protein
VYVAALAWGTTEADLDAHFKRVGAIQKTTLLTRVRNGEVVSKGCGTVEFKNASDVKRAVEALNGTELDGRVISVREDRVFEENARDETPKKEKRKRVRKPRGPRSEGAVPREPREAREPRERAPRAPREPLDVSNLAVDPRKVYVTSLAWSTTGDDLTNVFSGVGDVVNCEVIARRDGRSTGTAVVEFSTTREASEAIERMNGKNIDGREISARVYYIKE